MQLIHIIRVVIVNDDHIFITIETSRKILFFRTTVEHNFAFRFRFVCMNEIEFCIIDSWLHLSNCFSKCFFSNRRRNQFVRHVNLVQKTRINQVKRCNFDYFMKLSNLFDIVKEICVVIDWIRTKSHRRSFTSKNQNVFFFREFIIEMNLFFEISLLKRECQIIVWNSKLNRFIAIENFRCDKNVRMKRDRFFRRRVHFKCCECFNRCSFNAIILLFDRLCVEF